MRAMILAAGLGKRMLSLTQDTPKPLLKVAGRALIEHQLARLRAAGITEVVINHSYLGQQIEAALGAGERYGMQLRYSPEPLRLETAGGIIQALPLLEEPSFVVINADVWCDFDISALSPLAAGGDLATLVLVDNADHNPAGDFFLNTAGRVKHKLGEGESTLTFSGISVLHRDLFAACEPGPRPLLPLLNAAIDAGRVGGVYHQGVWVDVGTPERLAQVDALAQQEAAERSV